ncbi:HDOD domain-containing protein [Solimonas marina]|uniref:HDOD domain-containing protein n=1 Tax=Solimonas marina TaxID=2714601 RepID=A0A969W6T9_9GAMM|nr:HDOD domain-containing protein [Solimonas marina]NKF21662.1 HDOD domain-containing protein [Solimonas marina]
MSPQAFIMVLEDRFQRVVIDALARDRLVLPTLPEIALHVRQLAQRDDVSAAALAQEIQKDASLAVRLIRVANSAAQRGGTRVDNVRQAITRLGFDYTRLLVSGLAIEQMFARGAPLIERRLRLSWQRSTEVAAAAQVLAAQCTLLNPEMAMLAGLVHDIGVLAILRLAEAHQDSLDHEAEIDNVVEVLSPRIGCMVLQAWHFPPELVDVPQQWHQFDADSDGAAEYADVVRVAVLQTSAGREPPYAAIDRAQVPAYRKLDVSPDVDVMNMDGYSSLFDSARPAA